MLVPVAIKEGVKDFLQIKLNKEAPKVSAASVFLPDEGTARDIQVSRSARW